MIKLCTYVANSRINCKAVYNSQENEVDTIPKLNSDITLLIAYINIGFDSDTMVANQIWGFSPKDSWIEQKLSLPQISNNSDLKLVGDFEPGAWRLDRSSTWKTFFDSETGWLCIGNPNAEAQDNSVKFMENAVAVLTAEAELKGLWIQLSTD